MPNSSALSSSAFGVCVDAGVTCCLVADRGVRTRNASIGPLSTGSARRGRFTECSGPRGGDDPGDGGYSCSRRLVCDRGVRSLVGDSELLAAPWGL